MAYQILMEKKAEKFLLKAPKKDANKIREHVDALASSPRPPGCKKLTGSENEYRLRVGVYRILYTVEDNILTIYVIDIDHRKDIYR